MKLNKKFLASLTALTMVVAPMSAFAANTTISGSGTVTELKTEIYNVVLPTSEAIDFKIDPMGVLSLNAGDTLADVLSNAAGTVTSSATAVINKSSVPINVNVDVSLAVSGATITLGTADEVAAGTADLYLAIEQLEGASLDTAPVTNGTVALTDVSGASLTATDLSGSVFSLTPGALSITGSAITTGAVYAVSASPTAIDMTLAGIPYAYEVTASGSSATATLSESAVTYTPDNVYAFVINGTAKTDADFWNEVAENATLSLNMTFTISKGDEAGSAVATEAYSYTSNNTVYIALTPFNGSTAPTPGFANSTISDVTNIKINGTAVSGASLVADYLALPFSAFSGSSSPYNITFTYKGVNYAVTVQS